ncbi:MAG: amidohydrolase [candidate division Zixibacteria bacterium]|nr:amidohydrolase [candidate division Zixibacteria bacterium]
MKTEKEGLVLFNGRIYTQDQNRPRVSAVAILGNRIVDWGRDNIRSRYPSDRYAAINLKQKTVLPGFCDSHTHFLGYLHTLDRLNLEKSKSLEDALRRISQYVKGKKPDEWILGYNWDANLWKDSPSPDENHLDRISARHPMAFSSKDGHQLWVNSAALKTAGITFKTDGILKENSRQKIFQAIPLSENDKTAQRAFRNLHRKGITSIHNMENGASLEFFRRLEIDRRLPLRVWQTISKDGLDQAIRDGLKTGHGSDYLKIGGLKLFADGALGSRTALMFQPYETDRKNRGVENLTRPEMQKLVKKASQSGISAVIHAIGDRANFNALMALKNNGSNDRLRHRIEHAQLVRPRDLELFSHQNIIASCQPVHCPGDFKMALEHWGVRHENAYPLKSLLSKKVKLCFGSDFPLYDFDPILGIHSAVNRAFPKSRNSAWNPSQKITVAQAVTAYTANAAFAAGWERDLGTLAPGKLADMVVLSDDIHRLPPEKLDQTKVITTIFDGKVVYGE